VNIFLSSSLVGAPREPGAARFRLGSVRMAIALLQALCLLLMYRAWSSNAWPVSAPFVAGPLTLVLFFIPPIVASSLGQMEPPATAVWALLCAAFIAGLAVHDVWRDYTSLAATAMLKKREVLAPFPSTAVVWVMAAGLFIAQSLRMAAAADRRWIASYPRYFEQSWKLICQLVLSFLFVLAAWLVIYFGAKLLEVVSVDWFAEFVTEPPGHITIISLAFAIGMHITDQRPSLVKGARTVFLLLFSWLLPVATLMVCGFLLGLPLIGVDALWSTQDAARMLLLASAVLIVLINSAFQDGAAAVRTAKIIQVSGRIASLLLVPVTALAACALYLRAEQHGWTVRRLVVAYCLFIAACYSLGYARAALQRGSWLPSIPRVNILTAWIILAIVTLALSPALDPARLAARHQLARFNAGQVTVENFDVDYLKNESARYGIEVLEELQARSSEQTEKPLHDKVAEALTSKARGVIVFMPTPPANIAANLTVWPKSTRLPESFLRIPSRHWEKGDSPLCLVYVGERCDAFLLDVTGDGKNEIIIVSLSPDGRSLVLQENGTGTWESIGTFYYGLAGCKWIREAIRDGNYKAVAPQRNDVEFAGRRLAINQNYSHRDKCDDR
jgi:hypothetical protein